jgi:Fe-coproporphyrin III synthase
MPLTGSELRILQIHPTRRCNLRCQHCYSSSSPEERDRLDVALLKQGIEDASALGYNMLSISGGEPLLYPDLPELVRTGHELRMLTAVVTNGILINSQKLKEIGNFVDLLAISLDGAPLRHNRMRSAQRAFEQMEARLSGLRESNLTFGFVFTLTNENLEDLKWAANYAVTQGAALLQVHALERTGRATSMSEIGSPSGDDAGRAWTHRSAVMSIASRKTLHLVRYGQARAGRESRAMPCRCGA